MLKDVEERKFHGAILLPNSYGNVRSRYLKEPTGSCHDLCKYGRKHDFESDEKHLTFRKFIANRAALDAVQSPVNDSIATDRKKKLVIKMRASDTRNNVEKNIEAKKDEISDIMTPSSKHESDVCNSQLILPEESDGHTGSLATEIGLSVSSNVFFEATSPTHKSLESVKEIQAQADDDEKVQSQISAIVEAEKKTNIGLGASLVENKNIEIPQQLINSEPLDEEIYHVNISSMNKKQVNKSKGSSLVTKPTPAKNSILKLKNSSFSTRDSRGDINFFQGKAVTNLKQSTVSERLIVSKQKNSVSDKKSTFSKLQSSNPNAFFSLRKTNVSAIPVRSLIVRSTINASRCLNGPKILHGNSKTGRPEVGEMNSLKSRKAAISSNASVLTSMSLNARKSKYVKHATLKKSGIYKEGYGQIHEKILEDIKPISERKNLGINQNLSKESDGHSSESSVSRVSEEFVNRRIPKKHRHSSSMEEEKRRTRRTPAVPPAVSSSSPYKLKFKRGKVIELLEAEGVGPRRLRFRRGKLLGENPSGDVKRSSRRKRDIGEFNDSNSESHDIILKKANLESNGVKLKHQDAHVKKEMQALFNHVIEETASKLVEIRKSKVKALVGAFESVISLQET